MPRRTITVPLLNDRLATIHLARLVIGIVKGTTALPLLQVLHRENGLILFDESTLVFPPFRGPSLRLRRAPLNPAPRRARSHGSKWHDLKTAGTCVCSL